MTLCACRSTRLQTLWKCCEMDAHVHMWIQADTLLHPLNILSWRRVPGPGHRGRLRVCYHGIAGRPINLCVEGVWARRGGGDGEEGAAKCGWLEERGGPKVGRPKISGFFPFPAACVLSSLSWGSSRGSRPRSTQRGEVRRREGVQKGAKNHVGKDPPRDKKKRRVKNFSPSTHP